jgi:glycosyltransferase involved in cell wall biosynthesis
MAEPLITIAMSMLDAARTLPMALASILWQTHKNWELLLVDDGSQDESVRIAERFSDLRIRLSVDGSRKGLAARLNEIISAARGEYIARMDADDISYPERLARQLALFEEKPGVDLIGSAAVVFAGKGRPVGLLRVRAAHAEICAQPWAGFYLPHPTWMGRLSWFRAHRYDERSKSEDQQLLLGAYKRSHFAGISEPMLGYREDSIVLSRVLTRRYHMCRALLKEAPELATRGLVEQVAKAAFDAFAISTGLERKLLSHRARPLSEQDIARWQQVWNRCAQEAAGRLHEVSR